MEIIDWPKMTAIGGHWLKCSVSLSNFTGVVQADVHINGSRIWVNVDEKFVMIKEEFSKLFWAGFVAIGSYVLVNIENYNGIVTICDCQLLSSLKSNIDRSTNIKCNVGDIFELDSEMGLISVSASRVKEFG